HPLVAGDQVGVGVGEGVADVQRPRDRRRGGVDGVDLVAGLGAVETVDAGLVPYVDPFRLDAVERRLFGNAEGTRAVGHRGNGIGTGPLLAPAFSQGTTRGPAPVPGRPRRPPAGRPWQDGPTAASAARIPTSGPSPPARRRRGTRTEATGIRWQRKTAT